MLVNTSKLFHAHQAYPRVVWCVLFSFVLLLCGYAAIADKRDVPNNNKNNNNPYGAHPYSTNSADPWDPEPGGPGYDETSVFINVQRIGGIEVSAVIKE